MAPARPDPRHLPAPHGVPSPSSRLQSARVVITKLPGQSGPGDKVGSLNFRWPDGSSRFQEIRWSVKPSLQIVPTALILKAGSGPTDVAVEVRSDDQPFRVVGVSGDLIVKDVPSSGRSETSQTVRISLDPGLIATGTRPRIAIGTDHPDQPTLMLNVVVLPAAKRGSE